MAGERGATRVGADGTGGVRCGQVVWDESAGRYGVVVGLLVRPGPYGGQLLFCYVRAGDDVWLTGAARLAPA